MKNLLKIKLSKILILQLSTFFSLICFLCFPFLNSFSHEFNNQKKPIPASRVSELSGIKLKEESKDIWDKKYNNNIYIYGKGPAKFLEENIQYIPLRSKILDIGMGEGRNAVFLAKKGHHVVGIDISSVAVKKAESLAKEFNVRLNGIVTSFKDFNPPDEEFDVILCFYFVNKDLHKKMLKWLKPGGLLIYESFTTNQLKVKNFDSANYGPQDYLKPQELIFLFPSMTIIKYEEPLHYDEFRSSIILRKIFKIHDSKLEDKNDKDDIKFKRGPYITR